MVFGQSGDLFNFYKADALNLVDSDPVILENGSSQVAIGARATPLRGGVFVLTESAVQNLITSTGAITPTTGSITPSTDVQTHNIAPVVLGSVLYMVGPAEGNSSLYQVVYSDQQVTTLAESVTQHIPDLLPADPTWLAGDTASNSIMLATRGSATLYPYRAYWDAGRRVLESWSAWTLPSGVTVGGSATIGGSLYLLVKDAGGDIFIERLPLSTESPASGWQEVVHLDRRVAVASGSYDGGTGKTTFDVSPLDGADLDTVVLGPAFGASEGTEIPKDSAAGNNLLVDGDYSAGAVVAGKAFASSVLLTRPFFSERAGDPDLALGVRIGSVTVRHRGTGPYSVAASFDDGNDTDTQTFAPTALVESEGEFRAWLTGNAERITVTISATGALPANWTGLRWAVEEREADL